MIDVVIVTSNRADYLRRCLAGYVRQAHKDIAVVIADDGSIDETEQVVKEFKNLAPFSITHVWQEKNGFRRPKIMNEAVKACAHDYLFFTDCDCLPAEDILDVHLRHMSRKVFILGGAIKLSKERTDSILKDFDNNPSYLPAPVSDDLAELRKRRSKARRQMLFRRKRAPHIYGVNFSLYKNSFLAVNGYDENFVGWGNADGDLRERLKRAGLKPSVLYDEAIVYHLSHPRDPSASLRQNRDYARRRNIPLRCLNGIEKLQATDKAR